MKSVQLIIISLLLFSFSAYAQEKIKVSGECGMCKSKIERAAKAAGASYAEWDVQKKELTVRFDHTSSSVAKIEKAIAAVGYDTENEKASDEAYDKLHECCKYERTTSSANEAKSNCCKDGKCSSDKCADCCKDGKCTMNKDCCKDGKCAAHSIAKQDGATCCKNLNSKKI